MVDFSSFNSIIALTSHFNSNERCTAAIVESRWPDSDIVCPYCGGHHCVTRKDGKFRCKECGRNFTCLVGTILQNTKLPLIKWFVAMYLISANKKGVSSHQLARHIDVTQTTAWYMLQKIRLLYPQTDEESFSGTIECDEVYIGGKEKWKHKSMRTPKTQGRSTKTKTPVFGMMERRTVTNSKGEVEPMPVVHAFVVKKVDGPTVKTFIEQFVDEGSTIFTDELNVYNGLEGYTHGVVHHGVEEYADGEVSTNSIEGFWSHFRRMINGCYHDVSDKHQQSYIDEAVFRWNTRKMDESERFAHMFCKSIGLVRKWSDIRVGLMAA